MQFADKELRCLRCESTFVFTADEQVFFSGKKFVHEPKHCKLCRAKRSMGCLRARAETRTTCAECGIETTVPFKPTKGLPVMCRSCFQKLRTPLQPVVHGCVPQLA
jgi:CxxC-x17-CxxC domain-containing protein